MRAPRTCMCAALSTSCEFCMPKHTWEILGRGNPLYLHHLLIHHLHIHHLHHHHHHLLHHHHHLYHLQLPVPVPLVTLPVLFLHHGAAAGVADVADEAGVAGGAPRQLRLVTSCSWTTSGSARQGSGGDQHRVYSQGTTERQLDKANPVMQQLHRF